MTAIRLAELPGHRLEAAVRQAPLAILPTGSIEFHGPHGPLGTDLHLAEVLAQRVADDLGALLLPPVAFSHCPLATRPYPGTIDIAETTLAAYLEDLVAGVYRMGVRGVLVLNAHDGNIRPAQSAADRLVNRFSDRFLLLVNWWETLASAELEVMGLFTQDGGHGHGGPLEMSAAGAARPGTVDWSVARDLDVVFSPGERIVHGLTEGRPLPNWQGYHGRTTEGSLEKGELLLRLAGERITSLTRSWLHELRVDD
jgi:creatinine amidohydrolase